MGVCSGFVRKRQAAKHGIVTRTNKQQSAKQQLQNIISINMISYFIYPLFFASVQSIIPAELLYGPRLDNMLKCAKSLEKLTSYQCDIKDPVIKELTIDYLCRYSIDKVTRYGPPNRSYVTKERVLKKCYCCGFDYEYIEYGRFCTGYCDGEDGEERKSGIDPIINLPFNWGDDCPEAKYDGDGNKVELEPCMSLSDILQEKNKKPNSNEPLIRQSNRRKTITTRPKQNRRKTTTFAPARTTTTTTTTRRTTTRRTTTKRITTTWRTTTTRRTTTTFAPKSKGTTVFSTTAKSTTKRIRTTTIFPKSTTAKEKKFTEEFIQDTSSDYDGNQLWSSNPSKI